MSRWPAAGQPPSQHGKAGCNDRCCWCGIRPDIASATGNYLRWWPWRRSKRPCLGPIAAINLYQAVRDSNRGLHPRKQAAIRTDQRLASGILGSEGFCGSGRGDSTWMIDEIITKPTFDAQIPMVHRALKRGSNFIDVILIDVQLQVAPDATIGAGCRNNAVRLDHDSSFAGDGRARRRARTV